MIVAIVQARVSSMRLPGKILKTIVGKPMLQLQLERLQLVKKMDQLVVATSHDASDDPVEQLCQRLNIACFRGSIDDVLDRFYQAGNYFHADHVVRLTGDCPLTDPLLIDEAIQYYLEGTFDYVSNGLEPTFPDGLDVEIFRFTALKHAWEEAQLPSQREHVSPFIYQFNSPYRIGSFKGNLDRSDLRWTVDEAEDFEFVRRVYEALYPQKPQFTTEDIIELLGQHPELVSINSHYKRNEGYLNSLLKDKTVNGSQVKTNCLAMQDRAKRRIPGMTQLLSKRPDQFSLGVWPGYYSKAEGAHVWDLDGNCYLDMSIGGLGANVLGYQDPDVDSAVKATIQLGNSCSLNCPEEVELADLLCEIHPWAEKVRYARTGGESMALAVRIARAFTGRDKVAFCGYHGWHDWYLAANLGTEDALGEHLLAGLSPRGVPRGLQGTALPFQYNQLEELKSIVTCHKDDLAAVIMEPLRNEQPKEGFLQGVRALADEAGAVFIFDEISSGFRMNSGGTHLTLGVEPDMAVFSKALGNGYPIGAVIGRVEVMQAAQQTFISSTYWTEKIGPTAALAMIRKHQKANVGEHLMKIGSQVQNGWKEQAEKHGIAIQVGGIPPLSHFSFENQKALVMKALFVQFMLEKGFLASTSFYAMFTHQPEHVKQYLQAVDETFAELVDGEKKVTLESMLKGQPAVSGFKRLT